MAITRIGNIANTIPDNSIANSKLTDIVNFKNIIINGDMSIAQRGTSATGLGDGDIGYHTCDRWRFQELGTPTYEFTQTQSTDVPSGQGFATSLKMDCTTADASLSASDAVTIRQKIEGQNLQYIKKGTANAESLTCSFWVKSNKTGTYIIQIRDNDNSRQISKSYTIDSASTWEKKTITFAGDTTGTLDNDNNASLFFDFWLGAGTDYTSGTLATSWEASALNTNTAVGQVNIADSTANDWFVTGVQLEIGSAASDFEFLPVDVNLQRCLRYYEKLYSLTTAPADGATNYTFGGAAGEASWTCFTTNNIGSGTKFKVEKRTTPTITLFRGTATVTAGLPAYYNDSDAWAVVTSPTITVNDSLGFFIRSAVTATRGRSYLFEGGWTASAEL